MTQDATTQVVRAEKTQRPSAPPRRGCFGCLGRAMVISILLVAILVFAGVGLVSALLYTDLTTEIEDGIAKLDQVDERETFETTLIYDRNGEVLWEIFGEGKRTAVDLTNVPQHLIDATIAVEDDTFYENIGLDAPSLVAALVYNFRNPDERPVGGSTITQQIVRHIAFDYEERTAVSYSRKTKEILLAYVMTQKYSKDEILSLYLNEIYYGNLAYGIEAAAQTYFGKNASELTLAEATLLAGLPQSPVELDPITQFEKAKERQWLVLNLMVSEGTLTQDEITDIYQTPLEFAQQEVNLAAPHFSVYVRQQLEEMFSPEQVANGGLRVTTSLDLTMQKMAEQKARQHVESIPAANNLTNASVVMIKPSTGEIIAMVGSVDYDDETIDGHVNVALTPQQPGSSIKPLTYALALSPDPETGVPAWDMGDILWDVEVEYGQTSGQNYAPLNYDRRFHGPVRLRTALSNSFNVPAVLLLQDMGVANFIDFAKKMGINSFTDDPSRYGLSITLGGGELTPLELAGAYAVFANNGYRIPPVSILEVKDSSGEVLYEYERPSPEPALDPRVAFLISDMLDDDEARRPAMGYNNPLELTFPAAAKTGTTNDFRDNWTMGYTPGLVVGVWTGNTDNSEMVDISGLTGAAPLWQDVMETVYGNYELLDILSIDGAPPPTDFAQPSGLERVSLCTIGSVTVGATECAATTSEWQLTRTTTSTPPASGDVVQWEEVDTAVYRIPALALPPLPPEAIAQEASTRDDDAPPPQVMCHFTQAFDVALLPPESLPQLFLTPPRNPESLKGAHEWAQANNLALLPTQACNEELIALAADPNRPAVYRIINPADGDTVSGILPIEGIASFDPAVVQFYKIELGIPRDVNNLQENTVDWVTLGDTHTTPVSNGMLEMLHADALPAGPYLLRLIVVKDSNYVGEPHMIQINIE